jgi:ankyrin repeat protein
MSVLARSKLRFIPLVVLAFGMFAHAGLACAAPAVTPPPDELAMIVAASTGNLEAVKRLLSGGMDLDHSDFTGNTPLIYAARYARVALLEFLLRRGADVNAYTHWGTTALIEAVRKGNLPVVRDLLDAGADVNQLDNRHESALFDAVKYRRLWAVNMLLYRNAQVDIKDKLGYTPLMYAAEAHQAQIMAALQRKSGGEDLSAFDNVPASPTPVDAAIVNLSYPSPGSLHVSSVSPMRRSAAAGAEGRYR